MKDNISNNWRHSGQRILILIVLMQTVMLRVVSLSVTFFHCNAECHYAKRHADIRLAECQFFLRYAKCRSAECHYAECRGTIGQ